MDVLRKGLAKYLRATEADQARTSASLDRSAERVQGLDRSTEQGPSTLPRATIFQVMGMLRSAKGLLNGLYPKGAEGAITQAQDSIESAHWKLNKVSSKFTESVGEAALVMDSTYDGPRWRYGLSYRPVGYAQVPDGWIIQSDRKDPKFNHGTIDYPFELSANDVRQFELTPVGKVSESVQEQVDHWTPQDARELKAGKFQQQGPEWIRVIGNYTLKIWMVSPGDWRAQAIGPGRKVTVSATGAKDAVGKSSAALMQVTESVQEKSLADQAYGRGKANQNEIGPLVKYGKNDYHVEVNGQRFPVHRDVVDYRGIDPVYQYFIIGSRSMNPSGQGKLGQAKTPRGVPGALKRLRFKIVKGNPAH